MKRWTLKEPVEEPLGPRALACRFFKPEQFVEVDPALVEAERAILVLAESIARLLESRCETGDCILDSREVDLVQRVRALSALRRARKEAT